MTPQLVILDANAIIGDLRFRRPSSRELLNASSHGDAAVAVPDVALREAVNYVFVQARQLASENRKARKTAGRLGVEWVAEVDPEAVRSEYDAWLRAELASSQVSVLPTPAVDHDILVGWAVDRRKPFKADGSGYRDALIWMTVVEAAEHRQVVFVSANWRDFASDGHGDTLAPELQADLSEDSGPVRLVKSLGDALALLSPADDVAHALERAISDETDPYDELIQQIENRLLDLDLGNVDVDGLDEVDELVPENGYVTGVVLTSASRIGDGLYVTEFDVEADVDVHVTGYAEVEDDDLDGDDWVTRWRYKRVSKSRTAGLSFAVDCHYHRQSGTFSEVNLGVGRGRVRYSF